MISTKDFDLASLPVPLAQLVQKQLKALGFYRGTTKGMPGPKTKAAFLAYLDSLKPAATESNVIDLFIKIARAEVGTRETGGNNRGPRVQEYQSATWLVGTGWAWCAAFVCWVLRELAKQHDLPFALPRGAGAFWFEDWAREQGVKVLTGRATVRRGDIVIYSYSHIEIASGNEKNGKFRAIGGNTNSAASREGEGVYEKFRKKSTVRSILRPFNA